MYVFSLFYLPESTHKPAKHEQWVNLSYTRHYAKDAVHHHTENYRIPSAFGIRHVAPN